MAVAKLDENSRPTLTALSSSNDGSIVTLYADPTTHRLLVDSASGTGTVSSVSVVTANGLSGTVATPTTTPAITLNISGLDAAKIADASVSNTKFQYLAGVTSDLQTQINSKGAGTVTAVSIATANGVSGSSSGGATPALTITLGAITPTTVNGNTFTTGSSTYTGTAGQTYTFPTTSATIARTDAANTFTGTQTFNGTVALGAQSITITGSIAATGARVTKGWFTDIESTNMPTVGGTAILTSLTAPQFTTIELGNASDTTLSRSAGGVLAVEGVVIPSISSTNTLSNKRVTRRLTTTNAPGATPTTNTDNVDIMNFTGLGTDITSMTTNLSGTPVDGDLVEFRFTDAGTARGITWGASFASTTVILPTTTVISTMLRVGFEFSGSTWKCIATA